MKKALLLAAGSFIWRVIQKRLRKKRGAEPRHGIARPQHNSRGG